MKLVRDILRRAERHFAEGGRLRPARPVYEALENFFFAPATRTACAPHTRDPLDVKRYMSMVIVALMPCVAASIYFFGWRLVPMILVSYAAGGAVEVIFAILRKEPIAEGFLVTGMLFPLILPPALPLWMVAAGVAFGVLVGKEVFGGTGRNLFNPAVVGRVFLTLAYAPTMAKSWIAAGGAWPGRLGQYVSASTVDAVSQATPLGLAPAQRGSVSLWDLLIGNVSGSAGETCALAILLGGGFLVAVRVANWRTVAAILGSFLAVAAGMHLAAPAQVPTPAWWLMSGGLLFGAFFMATDPVTSPTTRGGKWIYGILIGVLVALIRRAEGFPEGMMFAILLGNIAAPILDEVVVHFRLRRLRNEA